MDKLFGEIDNVEAGEHDVATGKLEQRTYSVTAGQTPEPDTTAEGDKTMNTTQVERLEKV